MIEFKNFIDFPRGTMYEILKDAYSFDSRNKEIWDDNWKFFKEYKNSDFMK